VQTLTRSLPWLLIAALAILAGRFEVDLRLIAGVACGLAVLSGSGALGSLRAPKKRRS
jgi:hypothetical protein